MNHSILKTTILATLLLSGMQGFAQAENSLATPEDRQFKEKTDQGVTPESMDAGSFKDIGEPDPLYPFEKKPEGIDPQKAGAASSSPSAEGEVAPPPPVIEDSSKQTEATEAAKGSASSAASSDVSKVSKKSKAKKKKQKLVSKDPDYKKEKRFHQIYKKYNEIPLSQDVWDQAAGPKKSETYKIQKGDNLWSLSKTFFGDSYYWPKIWGLNNDEMYNPHQIDTWMTLRFYPGTLDMPPMMGAVTERLPEDPQVEVPKSKRKIQPVLKKLPESLPAYKYAVKLKKDDTDFTLLKPLTKQKHPPVYLTYFAWDSSIEGVGSVYETELGLKTASDFQYVYLQIESGRAKKTYSIIKEIGMVKGTDYPLIEVQGEVEVVESLPNQEGLYKAIVKKTLMPIEVGARLIGEPLLTLNVEPTPVKFIEGVRLIGGEYNPNRNLLADKSFVFVDGGRQSGIRENMTLEIFAENQVRNPESKIEGAKKKIGQVKILKVGDSVSTGYMLGQVDEVAVGDPVGDRNGQGIKVSGEVEPVDDSDGFEDSSGESNDSSDSTESAPEESTGGDSSDSSETSEEALEL